MVRKKETLTLSVPPGTKEKLDAIARRLKIFWGKSPSPSGLVVAIAEQALEVGVPFALNTNQISALRQSIKHLIDAGQVGEAQSVIALLLERGNLESPLRQSLLQQIDQSLENWRVRIEQQREKQQPFRLLYVNSQEQELEFTCRYAEICFFEKRFYLQVWCDETADALAENPTLPEFSHSRCLRLDRIKTLVPMEGEWRRYLDSIEVHLEFRKWLVKAYEPKPNDLKDEIVGDVRRVVRQVINPFWLIREIAPYWENCIVIQPESIRQYIQEKTRKLHTLYNLDNSNDL